jgi:hypothetical protein
VQLDLQPDGEVVVRATHEQVLGGEAAQVYTVYALEANLRKGGTTHPYAAMRSLVPGRYDPEVEAGRRGRQSARILLHRQASTAASASRQSAGTQPRLRRCTTPRATSSQPPRIPGYGSAAVLAEHVSPLQSDGLSAT